VSEEDFEDPPANTIEKQSRAYLLHDI
jgi:hypothetical protein